MKTLLSLRYCYKNLQVFLRNKQQQMPGLSLWAFPLSVFWSHNSSLPWEPSSPSDSFILFCTTSQAFSRGAFEIAHSTIWEGNSPLLLILSHVTQCMAFSALHILTNPFLTKREHRLEGWRELCSNCGFTSTYSYMEMDKLRSCFPHNSFVRKGT